MRKIIADSSANLLSPQRRRFPFHPHGHPRRGAGFSGRRPAGHRRYDGLPVHLQGPPGTACPGPDGWMNAFAGADEIFVVTITSGLSGTHGSAMAAKDPTSRSTPKSKSMCSTA